MLTIYLYILHIEVLVFWTSPSQIIQNRKQYF